MEIRRLRPADAKAYRELMLEAYAAAPEAFTSTVAEREPLPLGWWEERLRDDGSAAVFGAFRDAALVGSAGLAFETRAKSRHKALLFGMYVRPAARGCGAGRALVIAALQHAAAREGVRVVQLTVTEGNDEAQRLYARCGFEVFGVEPMAVKLGDRFAPKVHMWCAVGER